MKLYHNLTRCRFLYRVNRFIARCDLNGAETTVHVKNTGRLGELLLPGATVWLEESGNPARKTRYDLVAVENRGYVVNIDSQAPNRIVREWLEEGGLDGQMTMIRPEYTLGDSRYDFAFSRSADGTLTGLIEVKGVTLFDDQGCAFFPDAPTSRGVRHLCGLIQAARAGMEAAVVFVLQRDDVVCLRPNEQADPAFAQALRDAHAAGVKLIACVCRVTPDSCRITHTVPIMLS